MTRLWLICSVVAGVLAVQQDKQQPPVFRGTAESVAVYVTVTDKAGRLVTTLGRDDFRIFDNGRAQPVTLFDSSPQPVHLVVLLDVSGSMYGNLPLLQAACDQLFAHLGADDLARVGTFGAEITFSPEFTRDPAALRAAVPDRIPPEAPTPLWTAVDQALDTFKDVRGRRVVLVLSDGKDSGPTKFGQPYITVVEVIDRAQREDVMIYGVGLQSRSARRPGRGFDIASMAADLPDPGLATLALDTGGGYFEIRPRDDLGTAFTRVVDELHSQYLLGFSPPAHDGKRHKVEVKLVPRDLKPRARKNYVAPKR